MSRDVRRRVCIAAGAVVAAVIAVGCGSSSSPSAAGTTSTASGKAVTLTITSPATTPFCTSGPAGQVCGLRANDIVHPFLGIGAVIIRGAVSPPNASVYVGGYQLTVPGDGTFSTNDSLNPGRNDISIDASLSGYRDASTQLLVTYDAKAPDQAHIAPPVSVNPRTGTVTPGSTATTAGSTTTSTTPGLLKPAAPSTQTPASQGLATAQAAQKAADASPKTPQLWAAAGEAEYYVATLPTDYDASRGYTAAGRAALAKLKDAWSKYLALSPASPDLRLAAEVATVFGSQPPVGIGDYATAATAQAVVTAAEPSATQYAYLAYYAYNAREITLGDRAAARAIALTPASGRAAERATLTKIKDAALAIAGPSGATGSSG